MGSRNNLNVIFKTSDKCALPYYNQEISPNTFQFQNLNLVRFTNKDLYQIPDLVGDDASKDNVQSNETEVYNETNELFTNEDGVFVYTNELPQDPLFVTNKAHSSYTFTTAISNVSIRIMPSKNTITNPIEFYFPENTTNYKSIFIINYRSVIIKTVGSMFSKIRLLNVSQVQFVDANGNDITGIQTDVIGSERIDLASSVAYDTLAFRTSSIINLTGCNCTNSFVYDSDPVIHNLDVTNLEVVNGNPSFVNCKVHGEVTVKITEEFTSSIQIDSQTDFKPTALKIIIPSTSSSKKLMELDFDIVLLLASLKSDQLDYVRSATKFYDQSGNELNSYKIVQSKDQKGVYLAKSDLEETNVPSTVNTDSFLIDYVTDLSSQYDINPPPPNTSFTDSISDPLWEDYPQIEDEEEDDNNEINGNNDDGKKKGLSAGAIAGIVIGVVIVVAAAVVVAILVLRRKKVYVDSSEDNAPDQNNENNENANDKNEQVDNSDPF